jgi:ABC-type sugar transport system permease subunit
VSMIDTGADAPVVAEDSVVRPERGVERLLAGNAWLVFAFLYLPILLLVVLSFNDNRVVGVWTEPSLRWYRALFTDRACSGRCATRSSWRSSPPIVSTSSAPQPGCRWSGSATAASAPSTACSTCRSSSRT